MSKLGRQTCNPHCVASSFASSAVSILPCNATPVKTYEQIMDPNNDTFLFAKLSQWGAVALAPMDLYRTHPGQWTSGQADQLDTWEPLKLWSPKRENIGKPLNEIPNLDRFALRNIPYPSHSLSQFASSCFMLLVALHYSPLLAFTTNQPSLLPTPN